MRRLLALSFMLAACADRVGSNAEPIQGGVTDDSDTAVVAVYDSSTTALGSGVLLAPHLVATARHAVAAVLGGTQISCATSSFGAVTDASHIWVTTQSPIDTSHLEAFTQAAQIVVPNESEYCGNDIAFIVLSKNIAISKYATPSIDPPMTDHTHYGYVEAAVGYGVTGPASGGQGTRRIKTGIGIQCIPHDPDPNRDCTKVIAGWQSYMAAGEFRTGDGVCPGDSGGPAFEQSSYDAGDLVALGVLSRGGIEGSSCVTGVYTRFDAWATLAVDTALAAAKLGGYPPPAWTIASDDAGAAPPDAAPLSDASAPDEAGVEPSPPSSGCALAPGSSESGATIFLVAALALARRRKRAIGPADRALHQ